MIVEQYEQNSALRREEERKRVLQQKQDQERAFIKKMQDIKNKMEAQQVLQIRQQLQNSSMWSRYWSARIAALPEEERITHEDVTEERILSRREL